MRAALSLVLAVLLSIPLTAQSSRVSGTNARKFRKLFAAALVDAKAANRLESEAKKLGKKYEVEALRQLLAFGPMVDSGKPKPRKLKGRKREKFETFDSVLSGLSFPFEGGAIGYDVELPKGFDNRVPVPVLIDPGHGTGAKKDQEGKADFLPFFRNMAKQAGGADWLVVRTEIIEQIGAGGLRGGLPDEDLLPAFDALMRDLASRFAIDPDRIYVAGLSQTGFWSWYLGRAQPQRYAAIVPMASVTWQVNRFLENFSHLPVFVLHGDEDQTCPVAQARSTTAKLKEMGAPVVYEEIAGAGHEGRVWGRLGMMLKQAADTPRVRFPKKIRHAFGGPQSSRAYWLEVPKFSEKGDGKAGSPPVARIELAVDGQKIRIDRCEGIKTLVLGLVPDLIDFDQPVTVTLGGKKIHGGKAKPDFARSVAFALRHADWTAAPAAFITLKIP